MATKYRHPQMLTVSIATQKEIGQYYTAKFTFPQNIKICISKNYSCIHIIADIYAGSLFLAIYWLFTSSFLNFHGGESLKVWSITIHKFTDSHFTNSQIHISQIHNSQIHNSQIHNLQSFRNSLSWFWWIGMNFNGLWAHILAIVHKFRVISGIFQSYQYSH